MSLAAQEQGHSARSPQHAALWAFAHKDTTKKYQP